MARVADALEAVMNLTPHSEKQKGQTACVGETYQRFHRVVPADASMPLVSAAETPHDQSADERVVHLRDDALIDQSA